MEQKSIKLTPSTENVDIPDISAFEYDQTDIQKRLVVSYLIAHTLSSAKSLKKDAPKLLELIGETFDWELGILWLIDEKDKKAKYLTSWCTESTFSKQFIEVSKNTEFPPGVGMIGKIWKSKKATWIQNIENKLTKERGKAAKKNSLRSAFFFPIIDENEVLGITEFYSSQKRSVDENVFKIVDSVSFQIAQFIKRKNAETDLNRTLNQLQTVLESVPHGITAEDKVGKVVYTNSAAVRILELNSTNELKEQSIKKAFKKYNIYTKEGKKVSFKDLPAAKVFEGKKEDTQLLKFINKNTDEERWLRIKATATHPGQREMVIKLFQDVTRSVEERDQQQLFLGIVSHEFRSPLASIKAYIQLLEKRLKNENNDEVLEFLSSVHTQTDRLTKLVNDIMDTTRIKAGLLKLNSGFQNYSEFVENVVESFQPTAPKNKIYLKIPRSFTLHFDRDRMTQVLVNLLTNAVNHSPEGSPITVSITKDDDCVITSVKDRGSGIPKEFKKKMFKLYSRYDTNKKNGVKGLGMGLFIVSAIVRSHGGKIWVDSTEGKGSTFYYCLPLK